MTGPVLHLDTEELWQAFEGFNPVQALAEELVGRAADAAEWERRQPGRLAPWRGKTPEPATELVVLEDLRGRATCVLPAPALRMLRATALAAVAARELVVPGVVTAAVLGSGPAAQPLIALISRYVPGVSHIAVWQVGNAGVEPEARDQLDLAGIGVSISSDAREVVFGANLVITAGTGLEHLEIRHFARGAVLVNATTRDLPNNVVDQMDHIYVDDGGLLESNRHRYVVNRHFAELDEPRRRQPAHAGYVWPGIETDLCHLLAGRLTGRRHLDDIVLVELLSASELSALFAHRLYQAAHERGLGTQL